MSDSDTVIASLVSENAPIGTYVGLTAFASDEDLEDSVSYKLLNVGLDQNGNDKFVIDSSTGKVSVGGNLDFEQENFERIILVAESSDGSTTTQQVTIVVHNNELGLGGEGTTGDTDNSVGLITDINVVDEPIVDDAAIGTEVGITASATDLDAGDEVSYTLSASDLSAGLFAIDSETGVVTLAGTLDFDVAQSHTINVIATSTDNSTSTQNFTIEVVGNDGPDAVDDNKQWVDVSSEISVTGFSGAHSVGIKHDDDMSSRAEGDLFDYANVGNDGASVLIYGGSETGRYYVQRINADGSKDGDAVELSGSQGLAALNLEPKISQVSSSGDYAVTFIGENSDGTKAVFTQKYDNDGSTIGAQQKIDIETGSVEGGGSSGGDTGGIGGVDPTAGVPIAHAATTSRDRESFDAKTQVQLENGNVVITWVGYTTAVPYALVNMQVYAKVEDGNGNIIKDQFIVNEWQGVPGDDTSKRFHSTAISESADGGFNIFWQSYGQTAVTSTDPDRAGNKRTDVILRSFSSDGTPVSGEIVIEELRSSSHTGNVEKITASGGDIVPLLLEDGSTIITWEEDSEFYSPNTHVKSMVIDSDLNVIKPEADLFSTSNRSFNGRDKGGDKVIEAHKFYQQGEANAIETKNGLVIYTATGKVGQGAGKNDYAAWSWVVDPSTNTLVGDTKQVSIPGSAGGVLSVGVSYDPTTELYAVLQVSTYTGKFYRTDLDANGQIVNPAKLLGTLNDAVSRPGLTFEAGSVAAEIDAEGNVVVLYTYSDHSIATGDRSSINSAVFPVSGGSPVIEEEHFGSGMSVGGSAGLTQLDNGAFSYTFAAIGGGGSAVWKGQFIIDGAAGKAPKPTDSNPLDANEVFITPTADDGSYIVAFTSVNPETSTLNVYAQKFSADGEKSGGVENLTPASLRDGQGVQDQALVQSGDGYILSFTDGDASYVQVLNADLSPRHDVIQLDNVSSQPDVISVGNQGHYIVTYQSGSDDDSSTTVVMKRFDSNGNQVGDTTTFDTMSNKGNVSDVQSSIIELPDGGVVVTWAGFAHKNGEHDIYVKLYNAQGVEISSQILDTSGQDDLLPQVISVGVDGEYVVAWQSDAIYTQKFNADGTPDGDAVKAGPLDDLSQPASNVELIAIGTEGRFATTFESDGYLFTQTYNVDGSKSVIISDENQTGDLSLGNLNNEDPAAVYRVEYANGSLFIDGTRYASGSEISVADWENAVMKGVSQTDFDLQLFTQQHYTTQENQAIVIDVLANDFDPEGDNIWVSEINGVAVAIGEVVMVTVDGINIGSARYIDGQGIEFTPGAELKKLNKGDSEEYSFSYTITDGNGDNNKDTAIVTFTVTGLDDDANAPIAVDDLVTHKSTSSGEGAAQGSEYSIHDDLSGRQITSQVAVFDDGSYVVSYQGDKNAYLQRYDALGTKIGDEIPSVGSQGFTRVVVLDDGTMVVTTGSYDGDSSFQRYESDGSKLGTEVILASDSATIEDITTLSNGGFAIAMEPSNSDNKIHINLFDKEGGLDNVIKISPSTDSSDLYMKTPTIHELSDGSIRVVWGELNLSTAESEIKIQTFDAAGIALNSVITLHDGLILHPHARSELLADGGIFVTWIDDKGGDPHVYAQSYNADGSARSNAFQVDETGLTDTTSFYQQLSTAVLNNGNVVITWMVEPIEGDYHTLGDVDVMTRIFAPDGTAISDEFSVHSNLDTEQASPNTVAMPDGSFMITWSSYTDVRSSADIRAKRFEADGSEYSGLKNKINEDDIVTVDVLANDSDVNGDPLSITKIQDQDVKNGKVVNITIDGNVIGTAQVVDSKVVFKPSNELDKLSEGQTEVFTFDYTITDGLLETSANIILNITGTNDAPVITLESVRIVDENSEATIVGNVRDIDGVIDLNKSTFNAQNGTVTVNSATGDILYKPNEGFSGSDIINVRFSDNDDGVASNEFNVVVNRVNDAPVAVDDNFVPYENISHLASADNYTGSVNYVTDIAYLGRAAQNHHIMQVGNEGEFIIAWQSFMPGDSRTSIVVQRFNGDGAPISSAVVMDTDGNDNENNRPLITLLGDSGKFVVTWQGKENVANGDDYAIVTQVFNADGTIGAHEKIKIEPSTGRGIDEDQQVTAIGNDGEFIMVWYGQIGDKYYHFIQKFDADGNVATPTPTRFDYQGIKLEGDLKHDITAVGNDGSYVVTWVGLVGGVMQVFSQKYNSDGVEQGSVFTSSAGPKSTVYSQATSVIHEVADDGSYILVWSKFTSNGQAELYMQRFDSDGQAVTGSPIKVDDVGTNGVDYAPQVTNIGDDGRYAITWEAITNNARTGQVFVKVFNNDGTAVNSEPVALDGYSSIDLRETSPSITAVGKNGDFVITWESGVTNTDSAVFMQRFNESGQKIGDQIQLDAPSNTWNGVAKKLPQVIENGDDGAFNIVWRGDGSDSMVTSLNVQQFDANGQRVGDYGNGSGDFDISLDTSHINASQVKVTYSSGSLMFNGTLVESGGLVEIANWTNVKLVNVLGKDYDLKIEAFASENIEQDDTQMLDVLANDTDQDNDPLSIVEIQGQDVSAGETAAIVIDGVTIGHATVVNNDISFVPSDALHALSKGELASYTFDYKISDGIVNSNEANITIHVLGTNDAPVITLEDNRTLNEDSDALIVGNVSDVDGTIVLSKSTFSANNGMVTVDSDTGNILYKPNTNFSGIDTITVSFTDNDGANAEQQFTVEVNALNDAPIAVDDAQVVAVTPQTIVEETFNSESTGWTNQKISNNRLKIENGTQSSKVFDFGVEHAGQAVLISFKARGSSNWDGGSDKFNVTFNNQQVVNEAFTNSSWHDYENLEVILDSQGRVEIAFESLTDASNEDSFVDNLIIMTGADYGSDIQTFENDSLLIDVLANDTDADLDSLSITQIQGQDVSNGKVATVVIDGVTIGTANVVDNQVNFVPDDALNSLAQGEIESYTFGYVASDSTTDSNEANITIKIVGTNDAPEVSITKGIVEKSVQFEIIGNISDIDGTINFASNKTFINTTNGDVKIDQNTGDILYRNNSDADTDTLKITATDNLGAETVQSYNIDLLNINHTLTAINDDFTKDTSGSTGTTVTVTSGSEIKVNESSDAVDQFADIATLNDGSYVVVWSTYEDHGDHITYAQRFNSDGSKRDGQISVDEFSGDDENPTIAALSDGGYVIVWEDADGTALYFSMYDSSGNATGEGRTEIGVGYVENKSEPNVIGTSNGGFAIIYETVEQNKSQSADLNFHRIDKDGNNIGNPTVITNNNDIHQLSPNLVELDNGSFIATWMSWELTGMALYQQKISASGNKVGNPSLISTTDHNGADGTEHKHLTPVITKLDDGGYVIAWTSVINFEGHGDSANVMNVFAQRFDASGNPVGNEVEVNTTNLRDNSDTGAEQLGIAQLNDGNFVVTYAAKTNDYDLFAQVINSDGEKVGDEIKVNSSNDGNHYQPAIASTHDGFVVTWRSTGGDSELYTKQFTVENTPIVVDVTFDEDASVTLDVLANDIDIDNDGDVVEIDGQTVVGTTPVEITIKGKVIGEAAVINNKIVFTPSDELDKLTEGEVKNYKFTYKISDGEFNSTANVKIAIEGTNDNPIISFDSANVEQGTSFEVIGNISDIDGNIDFLKTTASANNGTVTIDETTGDILYSTIGSAKKDTITINAWDDEGGKTKVIHKLTINTESNQAPVAVDDDFTFSGSGSSTDISGTIDYSNFSGNIETFTRAKFDGSNKKDQSSNVDEYSPGSLVMLGTSGKFAVLYRMGDDPHWTEVQRFNSDGSTDGSPVVIQLDELADNYHLSPNLVAVGNNGAYSVQFNTILESTAAAEVYFQLVDENGNKQPLVNLTVSTNDSPYNIAPIATRIDDDGSYALTWQDTVQGENVIHVKTFDENGVEQSFVSVESPLGAYSHYESEISTVAFSDGSFIVQWTSSSQEGRNDLMMQRFSASGNTVGDVKIHSDVATEFRAYAVDGVELGGVDRFAQVWIDDTGSTEQLKSQVFDKNGATVGDRQTMDIASGDVNKGDVEALGDTGKFAIVYSAKENKNDNFDTVYVQVLGSNGQKATLIKLDDLKISGDYNGWQNTKSHNSMEIASLNSDGDFVVSWLSVDKGDSKTSVFNQVFNAAGQPQGDVFVVDGDGDKEISGISVEAAADGSILIAFNEGTTQYVQRMTADGKEWTGYTPGEKGTYDVDIDTSLPNVSSYSVTFSTGKLFVNGKRYNSGDEVPAADWKNVELRNVEGGKYDLEVEAIHNAGEIFTETTPFTLDVLDNDSDPDGDKLTIVAIDGKDATGGKTVEVTDNKGRVLGSARVVNDEIEFTPGTQIQKLNEGQQKDFSFDYSISDGKPGDPVSATVSFTVDGANDPNQAPVVENDTVASSSEYQDFSGSARLTNFTGNSADTFSVDALNGNDFVRTVEMTQLQNGNFVLLLETEVANSNMPWTSFEYEYINQVFSSTGELLGSHKVSNTAGHNQDTYKDKYGADEYTTFLTDFIVTALPDGSFVHTWASPANDVYMQKFDATGQKTGSQIQLQTPGESGNLESDIDVMFNDSTGDLFVSYVSRTQADQNSNQVFVQRVDTDLNLQGQAHGIADMTGWVITKQQQQPRIISSEENGDYYVAWQNDIGTGLTASTSWVNVQKFNEDGVAQGGITKLNGQQRDKLSGFLSTDDDGSYAVMINSNNPSPQGNGTVVVRVYDASTDNWKEIALNGEGHANFTSSRNEFDFGLKMQTVGPNGDFVVVWRGHSKEINDYDLYLQKFDKSGNTIGGRVRMESELETMLEATWVATSGTVTDEAALNIDVVETSKDGSFVVSWSGYSKETEQTDSYYQQFDGNGNKVGTPTTFYEATRTDTSMSSGGFVGANGVDGSLTFVWNVEAKYSRANTDIVETQFAIIDGDGNVVPRIDKNSVGNFDLDLSRLADDVTEIKVTFNKGSLKAGSTSYSSGDIIPRADFDNLTFMGVKTSNFEFKVEALVTDFPTENEILLIDVLANDTDPDGDALTITQINGKDVSDGQTVDVKVGNKVIGTARVVDGEIEFTPGNNIKKLNAGDTKEYQFNYTVDDGNDGIATGNVTFTIQGIDGISAELIGSSEPSFKLAKELVLESTVADVKTIDVDPNDVNDWFTDGQVESNTSSIIGLGDAVFDAENLQTDALATETVFDFNPNVDKLDLAEFALIEEQEPLDDYFEFNFTEEGTTILISDEGSDEVSTRIVLDGVDLSEAYGTVDTSEILHNLVGDKPNGALLQPRTVEPSDSVTKLDDIDDDII